MSRFFDTSGEQLRNASSFDLGSAGTVSFWYLPTAAFNDGVTRPFFDTRNAAANNFFTFEKANTNNYVVGWFTGGVNYRTNVSATGQTAGVWTNLAYKWNTATPIRNLFRDAVSLTSTSAAFSVWNTSGRPLTLGAAEGASGTPHANGSLAEVGVWSVDLTDSQIASLATGVSPLLIQPDNLVFYAPLIGNDSPEPDYVGGFNLTVTGATKSDHPRVLQPRKRNTFKTNGSAPPATLSFNPVYSTDNYLSRNRSIVRVGV